MEVRAGAAVAVGWLHRIDRGVHIVFIEILELLLSRDLANGSVILHPAVVGVLLGHVLNRHPLRQALVVVVDEHLAVTQLLLLLFFLKLLMSTDYTALVYYFGGLSL